MPLLLTPEVVIGGEPINVTDLLIAHHNIPAYQRDYVWQETHVKQLWDDLIDHFNRHPPLTNPAGYFLGPMVVIKRPGDKTLEVVDGQQRLMTLSTMATVLLDKLQELPPGDVGRAGLEQRLQNMLATYEGEWSSNLSFANQDLQSFFLQSCRLNVSRSDKETYWNNAPAADWLKRRRSPMLLLRRAIEVGYEKFDKFLAQATDQTSRRERIVGFVRLATEAVVLLRITALSYESAYSIFESLNNRNVPLSQADLIKNELLRAANASDRNDIIENWGAVREVELAEVLNVPELLHYSYLSRYGKVKAKELFTKVKEKLSAGGLSAIAYSDQLAEDAEAFEAISETFQANWTPNSTNMLKDIKNVLGVKLCYPFLIAAYRNFKNQPVDFEKAIRAVMNFAFRYIKVLDGSIETLATVISDASILLNTGQPLSEVTKLFRENAPDSLFSDKFETTSFQSTKLAYFAVYYLEASQSIGALPIAHGVDQNLEHIMPKKPSPGDWPDAHAWRDTDGDEFSEYLWRVGNLLPLPASINKSIKNKGIAFKISNPSSKDYSSPSLALVSPKKVALFLDNGKWSKESIQNRQKDLAQNWATKAWAL